MHEGPAPRIPQEAYAARRRRLADALEDHQALVVATHAEALHSGDVHHRFRPHSDFWYLTGFGEPDSVLVLLGGSGEATLFLDERDPKQEVWTGRRLGVERAREALDLDHAHPIGELSDRLPGLVRGRTVRAVMDHDPATAERIRNAVGSTEDSGPLLADMRCIKDADEVAMLQAAADAAIAGHLAALPTIRDGRNERHAEAAFLHAILDAGSEGPGYPPIVGAGANAAVLHYIDNNAPLAAGDMVLMDAGCQWGHYNSDITRTVPVDGQWTGRQRDLYDVVLRAQDAAIAAVRPGNTFNAPHDAAVRVLAEGLVDMGLVDADADAVIEDESYQRFYMHSTGHYLGLDVHDVGRVKEDDGSNRILEPGMVVTVEPGLYFNPDFAPLPDGMQPMGLRIENDIVVSDDGPHDLTRALTRNADELGALVRGD